MSNSLSKSTIGSAQLAASAAQGPDVATGDPSGDDSRSRRVQEGARTVCTIAGPFLEVIPIAGPPLKAAVGGLLKILNAIDVSPYQTCSVGHCFAWHVRVQC